MTWPKAWVFRSKPTTAWMVTRMQWWVRGNLVGKLLQRWQELCLFGHPIVVAGHRIARGRHWFMEWICVYKVWFAVQLKYNIDQHSTTIDISITMICNQIHSGKLTWQWKKVPMFNREYKSSNRPITMFTQGQTLVPYQCVVRRSDWEQMRTSFLEDGFYHAQWEYVCWTIIVYHFQMFCIYLYRYICNCKCKIHQNLTYHEIWYHEISDIVLHFGVNISVW